MAKEQTLIESGPITAAKFPEVPLMKNPTDCRSTWDNYHSVGRNNQCIDICKEYMNNIINPRPFTIPTAVFDSLKSIYTMWSPDDVALLNQWQSEAAVQADTKSTTGQEKKYWESLFWDYSSSSSHQEFFGDANGFTDHKVPVGQLFKEIWNE
jgi:hypothetical protein